MANKLAADKQRSVLHLLAEGNSLRSVERLTGVQKKTATRLMVRFGHACRQFLDEEMRGLKLDHVEIDEIWTFVGKKQARVHVDDRQTSPQGDTYLWVGIDAETKLVPSFIIGKRSADMARRFMVDLASRLDMPRPQDWWSTEFEKIVQISTDGFKVYPEAVDLAFGPYCKYGTIIKDYRNANRPPGNYSPGKIIGTTRQTRFGMAEDEIYTICTSHVERNNLTTRTFMKRFARLSLGFSKKLENLAAATALHFANYNFCWRPRYQDWSGKAGQLRPTPAMMAGVTNRLWKFDDLFEEVKARHLK